MALRDAQRRDFFIAPLREGWAKKTVHEHTGRVIASSGGTARRIAWSSRK
jgi:hypothetical protein